MPGYQGARNVSSPVVRLLYTSLSSREIFGLPSQRRHPFDTPHAHKDYRISLLKEKLFDRRMRDAVARRSSAL